MTNPKICIVGLGYVGLPLATAFSEKFQVIGFDINIKRIQELKKNIDKTHEVEKKVLESLGDKLKLTAEIKDIINCNIYIITVPTPIDKSNRPNLSPLIESSKMVGKVLNKEDIVIYESTVFPGVTEDICVPELEKSSGLKYNKDFFCGYSPERLSPGDDEHSITKIIKVTSGSTPEIAKKIDALYNQIIEAGTHLASSIKIAEASKAIENTQRDINIAFFNELAIIFDQMGIDSNEVIEAAATKWNFIKLSPGLVGGHCIGVDPYYLTYKAEQLGYKPNLILASRQVNNSMSKYITDKMITEMIKAGKKIKNAQILILGVTFKEDCPDMRNSKVIDIIEHLKEFDVKVDVFDPWVKPNEEKKYFKHGVISDPSKNKKKYDAILVAVAHKQFKKYSSKKFSELSNGVEVIIDIKNIVKKPTWRL